MCCDKNETIRLLSLYLQETQAQYNDCLSEAAEQGTLMELQRDAIQHLQNTVVRKDLMYYSLLIKAQELCRGHIQDVRIVKSKMNALVRSKKYLEDKYRRIKRLWQEADTQLRQAKCQTLCETNAQQESQCVDISTWTDDMELIENQDIEVKLNFLIRENEDLKRQICGRGIEFELFDHEVKNQMDVDKCFRELSRETNEIIRENDKSLAAENSRLQLVLKQHLSHAQVLIAELQYAKERETLRTNSASSASQTEIDAITIKDELHRRNVELDKLIAEARDKEQELGMLQDMRKEFERTECLERMNESLTKELSVLRQTAENNECSMGVKLRVVRRHPNNQVDDIISTCDENERPRKEEIEMIKQLKDQLSSTRQLTEECLVELRATKEILGLLSERICSLKRMLNEKSDDMAKLQTDHETIKNDYSILKMENGAFEEKARGEIQEFREKLKSLQSELRVVGDDYRRVSRDFDKTQELLIEAAKREVDLQHAITAMEQIFYAKLSTAEEENKRLSNLTNKLKSELKNTRDELTIRNDDFTKRYGYACEQIDSLEERLRTLDDAKHRVTRQLQDSRLENYTLIEENNRLTEGGCRCVKELEDTHKALLELKSECRAKSESLNCVSAELISVATSRTELCDESQHVVSCIRVWMDEQRRLVDNLSKKLKDEKNRCAQLVFEKKGLVATVRQLMRMNGTFVELSTRRKKRENFGHNWTRGNSKSSYCETSPMCCCTSKCSLCRKTRTTDAGSSATVQTRPLKRRCGFLRRTSRRSMTRENSSWSPKHENSRKQSCKKNRRHLEKIHDVWQSETSIDEARDFGYQSSASK